MSISVVKDITSEFCIGVKNNDARTNYNISVTNFPHTKIPELATNQTNNLCFNVTRAEVGNIVFSPTVYGMYKIQYLADPITRRILLSDLNNHTARINDKIELCNNFGSEHTIRESSNAWQIILLPSECRNVSEISYTQEIMDLNNSNRIGYFLFITNILEQYSRDNSFDASFNLYITTTFPQSQFTITKLVDNIITPYGIQTAGVMQVKNDQYAVQGVRLQIDWGAFDTPIVDFAVNETKYLNYKILPNLTANQQTNKSYDLKVSVRIDNFKESNTTLRVFVPYYQITPENESGNRTIIIIREMTTEEKIAFLKSSMGQDVIKWYCFDSDPNGTRSECQFFEKVYLNADLNETLARLTQKVDEGLTNVKNEVNDLKFSELAQIRNQTEGIKELYENKTIEIAESTNTLAEESEKNKKNFWTWFWIIIILFLLIGCAVTLIILKRKGNIERLSVLEQGDNPNKDLIVTKED